MRSHYRHIIAPQALVFDIGANRGDATAVFRTLGARVVSVEPVRETADQLKRRFAADPGVTVVEKAVTSSSGPVTLHINSISQLCSISSDWIDATERSGRFSAWGSRWLENRTVPSTTLDQLIAEFGRPQFCKIDVEGSEVDVLKGLSDPIEFLSLEFVAERPQITLACIALLDRIGFTSYNMSRGDTFRFVSSEWLTRAALAKCVSEPSAPTAWGDFYASHDLTAPVA
jgi:FkbM family methyltransferase